MTPKRLDETKGQRMKILVTGGAGYIGSHTCIELLESGHDVVVVDNLSNSKEEPLRRVRALTGKELAFYRVDLLDTEALERVFREQEIDAVIHFAALKAVGESVSEPLEYYRNNVAGTINLCETMARSGVRNMVFSSSATVYGEPRTSPIDESFPLSATNPYGQTKLMMEQILRDLQRSEPSWNIVILRYFNPVGAHESGRIGEDPNGVPNNLMPYISQVAIGKRERLSVFGGDYPTPDGTGIRDYIHVVDLARGHLNALDRMDRSPGLFICNLGTGTGYSVLEAVAAFEKASGRAIPHEIVARRPGDVAICYANPELAKRELGWEAARGLEEMCVDAWRWQSQNPAGYE